MEKIEIKGKIIDIIYRNEENNYTIASIDSNNEYIVITGYLPVLNEDETMIFTGSFVMHKTYGEQFKVESYKIVEPEDTEGILKYLKSGIVRGIGPSLAKSIVDKFGKETLDIIKFNPNKLLSIHGIGEKKLEEITESFAESRNMSEAIMFLQKYDISLNYSLKIYSEFKERTIKEISKNPYILAEKIRGIGFIKADSIARLIGIEKNSPYRIRSGIKYILTLIINNGHTFLAEEKLIKEASDLLLVEKELIREELTELILKAELIRKEYENEVVIYTKNLYQAELSVYKKILNLKEGYIEILDTEVEKEIEAYEKRYQITFAEKQKESIKASVEHGVFIISGGPGTGKTTIINAIIDIFEKMKLKVLLAAPTGRAAKRMTEATGKEAKTLHRLLEYKHTEDGPLSFNKNESDPLLADLIIVDEASMIDIKLMQHLLEAITVGTRLILVGDVDQLPSVGPGNVLSDLISSDIEKVFLNEIFRQSSESMIVTNAHKINNGLMPMVNKKDADFFFIKTKTEKDTVDTIINLCKNRLPEYYNITPNDIQVLSPMKKSKTGIDVLNEKLQEALNPSSDSLNELKYLQNIFREGDRVMQIKNNYDIEWESDYSKGKGVFNGDMGVITEIDEKNRKITVTFDDKLVEYSKELIGEIVLSYAVTVHKSQGSEFPVVIIPLYNIPYMLRNKNILYTGVTRAKKLVVLVGREDQIQYMVNNKSILKRNSGLGYMLNMKI